MRSPKEQYDVTTSDNEIDMVHYIHTLKSTTTHVCIILREQFLRRKFTSISRKCKGLSKTFQDIRSSIFVEVPIPDCIIAGCGFVTRTNLSTIAAGKTDIQFKWTNKDPFHTSSLLCKYCTEIYLGINRFTDFLWNSLS